MRLGQTIINIRKERGMTQEDFAKKFHVTRQTVSNWENEKSYPDLLTLVNISDEFHISLDTMLKEDKKMMLKMNRAIKFGKKTKYMLLCFIGVLILSSLIWLFVWKNAKISTEEKFQKAIVQNEFVFDEELGYYTKTVDNDTYFTLPNQKMPEYLDFTADFHAKFLKCYTENDGKLLQIIWSGKDEKGTFVFSISNSNKNGSFESSLTEEERDAIIKNNSDILNLVKEGNQIYEDAYKTEVQ